MSDWEGSIAFCSAALECNPQSVKAFYHRSKAHFAQKKFKEASEDAFKAD